MGLPTTSRCTSNLKWGRYAKGLGSITSGPQASASVMVRVIAFTVAPRSLAKVLPYRRSVRQHPESPAQMS
ncbi:MAG: hypothetical protein M3Q29_19990 [Chloroflexota bacterium]|nr:hypothetical protein [Chloroflexota bacterium]